jgi:crotonobetainyl-CoA:carnitine CoA-transferase CaiB-like acyl-CoA transferase
VVSSAWVGAVYNLNHHRIKDFTGLKERDGVPDEEAGSAKYQFYETQDGRHILFCCIEPKFWQAFCQAAGRPDLIDADSPSQPVDFALGQVALRRELQAVLSTRTQAEWVALAAEHDFALGPAHTLEDLPDDPQFLARRVLLDEPHPLAGDFTYVTLPALVDGERSGVARPAPTLGQHTEDVLTELGYGPDERDRLAAEGVTGRGAG